MLCRVESEPLGIGYYTVAPQSIEPEGVAERLRKGMPAARPIPVILLARLALDVAEHGNGLGGDLLRDALMRCMSAADEIGGRAVRVNALDEEAADFYRYYGFQPLETYPLDFYILMKDVRASLAATLP